MKSQETIKCIVKKIVIERFVAITPDGKEIEIRGIDKKKIIDGMSIEGHFHSKEIQDKYSDGSYARSYHTDEWLQVK